MTEIPIVRQQKKLWKILDDIDSIPDMLHPSTPDGYAKAAKLAANWAKTGIEAYPNDTDPHCKAMRALLQEIIDYVETRPVTSFENWSFIDRKHQRRFKIMTVDETSWKLVPVPVENLPAIE